MLNQTSSSRARTLTGSFWALRTPDAAGAVSTERKLPVVIVSRANQGVCAHSDVALRRVTHIGVQWNACVFLRGLRLHQLQHYIPLCWFYDTSLRPSCLTSLSKGDYPLMVACTDVDVRTTLHWVCPHETCKWKHSLWTRSPMAQFML